jgi:TonB family protein
MMHVLAIVFLAMQAATPAPAPSVDPCNRDATAIQIVSPGFPRAAVSRYKLGAQKTVRVKVTIGTSGRVLAASIFQSAGDAALDDVALRAAQLDTFSPRVVGCTPVTGDYLLQFDFVRNQ